MSADQLVPLAGVCLGSTVPPEHVRALVLAGRLPATAPGDLVPAHYLAELDTDPLLPVERESWRGHLERELRRFRDGRARLIDALGPEGAHRREQQLMRIGSAAWGVGLVLLVELHDAEARVWLDRAATFYRRSLADAEPGSWGRSVGALKARVLADDPRGAEREARLTLDLGAASASSTTARYAAALALLVLARDDEAAPLAAGLPGDPAFPRATARAVAALASSDATAYAESAAAVLETFESRERFLEDVPVADTVLTLQALARPRGLEVELRSPRLPERR